MTVEAVGDIRGGVLECPVWEPETETLWFVDIDRPSLNRWHPASNARQQWVLPEAIGSFALCRDGRLILALRSGLYRFDPAGETMHLVVHAPYDDERTRFNDGRCDRMGRFWVGSMYEPRDRPAAALFRLDHDCLLTTVVEGITLSNGLAFTTDGLWCYHADTPARTIWRARIDPARGTLSDREKFATLTPDQGRPDGAAIDAEDHYWVAAIDSGRLLRFRPDGTIERAVDLPTRWPTMMAFGGPDLKTLYVTSLRANRPADQLAASPLSGSLFALRVDVPGVVEPLFMG